MSTSRIIGFAGSLFSLTVLVAACGDSSSDGSGNGNGSGSRESFECCIDGDPFKCPDQAATDQCFDDRDSSGCNADSSIQCNSNTCSGGAKACSVDDNCDNGDHCTNSCCYANAVGSPCDADSDCGSDGACSDDYVCVEEQD